MGGEEALYQAGKIAADLHDPKRALGLLEARNREFPQGYRRMEAELLRAQLLASLGRPSEALAVTDQLLNDSSNRMALPQIHSVRGHIYQDGLHNCDKAAVEFVSLVGQSGELADDGELRRAMCLATLGRRADAAAAFEQYLNRKEPPRHAEVARAHLDSLHSGSDGK
jgi:hypothetical protein